MLAKVENTADKKLREIYNVASDGIQTSANKIYLLTEEETKEERIEEYLLKPIISGENVKRWFIKPSKGRYLIYPHEKGGKTNILTRINILGGMKIS